MGSGGKIDVYLDCNSPWSYLTLLKLRKERPALLAHGVEIEAHPVFLGGINVGSGNKPPWTLPAKAKLGQYELPRGLKYFDAPAISAPGFFPIMSLLPMRAMLYTKSAHPYSQYESAFLDLWVYLWQLHKDISKPDILAECLARHFKDSEVKEIVKAAQDPEWKAKLNEQTKMCVEKGAFGAPWWFVTNREGKEEPFFGSDRFHFIYQFLGVPFRDIEILPPGGESKL